MFSDRVDYNDSDRRDVPTLDSSVPTVAVKSPADLTRHETDIQGLQVDLTGHQTDLPEHQGHDGSRLSERQGVSADDDGN